MTYPNLTNEEIQKLRDVIGNTLGNMKKDIRKDKLKVFGKTLLSFLIVAGGVAVTVIFPLFSVGVLGGAATLIAGNSSIFGKAKKIKEKSKERKRNKEEAENMRIEQSDRKWASRVETIIDKKQTDQIPSAPPSYYPDLKEF